MNTISININARLVMRNFSMTLLLLLGMIEVSAVYAQTPANVYSYSRSSSFTYDPVNGLLLTETVEPNNPQLCVLTTYLYDSFGNKQSTTTANCPGATGQALFASRASTSTYAADTVTVNGVSVTAPAGTFQTTVANALNQSDSKTIDPRFGSQLSLTGPNGLTTSWQVDDFGRTILETHADGNSTATYYCLIAGRISDTTSNSNSTICSAPISTEIPALATSFIQVESHSISGTKNGPASRVYMDAAGRKIRSVTEAFDGANQVGGTARLIVQDTDYNDEGAVVVNTQPYFLDTLASTATATNTGNVNYGMSKSVLDILGRPIIVYTSDPKGSQANIGFGSRGSQVATMTTISYSGLVTITTNDLGQTRQEEKNIDGKVVRVTDATGAQIANQYDAFGNLIQTKDALQNSVKLTYDIRGHKLAMNDPDSGIWTYAYDALGELVSQQSPNQLHISANTTTSMTYDVLGRMTQRIEQEYTSSWSYDRYMNGSACNKGIGKLCESSTSSGVDRLNVYDNFGRPINQRTTITSGPSFASAVSYDTNGHLASQTYPTGLSVNYLYTTNGFLTTLTLGTPATVNPLPATAGGTPAISVNLLAGAILWQAVSVNAWGKTEQQSVGNGIISKATFDALTGRILQSTAGLTTSTTAMNYGYSWDSLSHLVGRTDSNGDGTTGAVTDTFGYDSIGRLQTYSVSSPTIPNLYRSVTLEYNALGSVLFKSDVGVYSYLPQGGIQPHALQNVSGYVNNSFSYDLNGNMVTSATSGYRSITYNSFNMPDSQTGIKGATGGSQYTWQYDENHQRIKEMRINSTGTRTTWMLHPDNAGGLGFESETNSNGIISNRHFLSVGGMSIGMLVSTTSLPTLLSTQTTPPVLASIILDGVEYWHKDHLGSLVSTTDQGGNVTARYSYDPFGKRRTASGQYDANGTIVIDWSDAVNYGDQRGYTGHEQLDDVGIIHMNGRTFDPLTGVFMQPDPLIQDPYNLQNFNRYGYCFNNPMTCTDPSGMSGWTDFRDSFTAMFSVFSDIAHTKVGYELGSVAIAVTSAVYCTPAAAAACDGAGMAAWAGFAGQSVHNALKTGLISGLTAEAMYGVGNATTATTNGLTSLTSPVWNTVGHAAVGCASSYASGGSCGSGALAGGFSAAWGNQGPGYASSNDVIGNTLISAMVGGTASVIGGGKFANGAITAAAGYLFNQLAHSSKAKPIPITDAERANAASGDVESFWKARQAQGDP
ncbi:RHS repeat domain-containing protein, partial [Sapientia aquatica]